MINNILKDKRNIALLIGIIILLILVIIFLTTTNTNSDAIKFKQEYEQLNNKENESGTNKNRSITIPKNNPIIYAKAGDIIKKIQNEETFAVYFGFEECPWCRSVLPNLLKAASDLKIDKIYYVNIKDIRDTIEYKDGELKTQKSGTNDYYKLLKLLDNVLDEYKVTDDDNNEKNTNEKRIYAPNVVAVVNGKAEKLTSGISTKQTDAYMKLTDKMNKESYNDFKCVLKCLQKTAKVCQKEKKC